MSAELAELLVEEKPDAVEPMAVDENLRQNHRQDFTSELFKVEISNTGKFGYGVCVFSVY